MPEADRDHLQIELLSCEEKLENAALDALVATVNIQHKTKYLQMLMQHLDNPFKGYFAVAKRSGELVAWTYVFTDRHFAFHGVFSGTLGKLYKRFPLKFHTAFISSPVAEYNLIHIKDSYRDQENVIIDSMMDAVLEFLKREGVKLVIVKDHLSPYTSQYFHEKFIHLHFMPGTFVDLEGICTCNHLCEEACHDGCVCFDAYLMGLKKKWRANIRNKMNRRKHDLIVENIPATSLSFEESIRCYDLYTQTREKQRLKHERLSPGYFYECGKEFGDCCKMLIARRGQTIIGFAQLLENEDDLINVRMGMDYAYNREYSLYYHLLYESMIYCVRKKKKRLYTSQTCYRPKIEVGAKLLPLHTYLYFKNPIFQKILGGIIVKNCRCYSELIETDRPSEVLSKHNICPY